MSFRHCDVNNGVTDHFPFLCVGGGEEQSKQGAKAISSEERRRSAMPSSL